MKAEAKRPRYKAPKLSKLAVDIMEKVFVNPKVKKLQKRVWMYRPKDPGYALARGMAMELISDAAHRLAALIDEGKFTEAYAHQVMKGPMFKPDVTWLIDNPDWWKEYVDALIKTMAPLYKKMSAKACTRTQRLCLIGGSSLNASVSAFKAEAYRSRTSVAQTKFTERDLEKAGKYVEYVLGHLGGPDASKMKQSTAWFFKTLKQAEDQWDKGLSLRSPRTVVDAGNLMNEAYTTFQSALTDILRSTSLLKSFEARLRK